MAQANHILDDLGRVKERLKTFWHLPPCGSPRPRRLISTILLLAGAGLLAFTATAYAWMSIKQHRLISTGFSGSVAVPATAANQTGAVTFLIIPKIDLQAAILDGTAQDSLLLAPGHLQRTPWPGDPGNAVIAAHRDTFFHRINELDTGDAILVRRAGSEYRYVVTEKAIVNPDNLAVTYPSSDTRMTLITCYPTSYIGPAPKRLVVVAKLQILAAAGTTGVISTK